jgi:cytochrome c5
MASKYLLAALVMLTSSAALAQAAPQNQPSTTDGSKNHAAAHTAPHEDEGTRIFQQNCSRCHNAPEGFSPRISGTIIRHMRVRASLSKHDEEALLRFLNP